MPGVRRHRLDCPRRQAQTRGTHSPSSAAIRRLYAGRLPGKSLGMTRAISDDPSQQWPRYSRVSAGLPRTCGTHYLAVTHCR